MSYTYVALYHRYNIKWDFGQLSNLSDVVDDLRRGITANWYSGWGMAEQVAVTRVTVDGRDMPAMASGGLDWDYVRQYPYSSVGDILFYVTLSLDASVPPPDAYQIFRWPRVRSSARLDQGVLVPEWPRVRSCTLWHVWAGWCAASVQLATGCLCVHLYMHTHGGQVHT